MLGSTEARYFTLRHNLSSTAATFHFFAQPNATVSQQSATLDRFYCNSTIDIYIMSCKSYNSCSSSFFCATHATWYQAHNSEQQFFSIFTGCSIPNTIVPKHPPFYSLSFLFLRFSYSNVNWVVGVEICQQWAILRQDETSLRKDFLGGGNSYL